MGVIQRVLDKEEDGKQLVRLHAMPTQLAVGREGWQRERGDKNAKCPLTPFYTGTLDPMVAN